MANVTEVAYQDLRNHIQTTWKYLELRNSAGTPILRTSTSDSRLSWTHEFNAQTLELTLVIQGTNADISLPQEFGQSALYNVASGGTPLSVETFSSFTMEGAGDQLTVKHRIEVPKIVAAT